MLPSELISSTHLHILSFSYPLQCLTYTLNTSPYPHTAGHGMHAHVCAQGLRRWCTKWTSTGIVPSWILIRFWDLMPRSLFSGKFMEFGRERT